MKGLTQYPHWALSVLTLLCVNQVKEQLTDNLVLPKSNPVSYVHEGHLFAYTANHSFFMDGLTSGSVCLLN